MIRYKDVKNNATVFISMTSLTWLTNKTHSVMRREAHKIKGLAALWHAYVTH